MLKTAPAFAPLFPEVTTRFPSTRYQGSKAKLLDWISGQVAGLEFSTVLDAFGGTGCVAHRMKQAGKNVTYNDILRFNYYIGLALIENSHVTLSLDDMDWILARHSNMVYPTFVTDTFGDIFFTAEENAWIDQTITNIRLLCDPYKMALAFFALCQACIVKRPYNLFHRKNLYIRLAEVERSFGNKASWDKPFPEWFRIFVNEGNQAIFDNGRKNIALNLDVMKAPDDFDLVYIDPPYISGSGVAVDYADFYHFLEGLTFYDEWHQHIDYQSKHRRLKTNPNPWTDKKQISAAFDHLFHRFRASILVVSYRSDGIPTEEELVRHMRKYKTNVRVEYYGKYKYALSKNDVSKEILIIGE